MFPEAWAPAARAADTTSDLLQKLVRSPIEGAWQAVQDGCTVALVVRCRADREVAWLFKAMRVAAGGE